MVSYNPLGSERISRLLFQFSLPSVIAMLVSTLYNIVDQIFIGQGVGMLGNGATTVAFPLSTICLAIALLLGVGSASCFSLQLGERREDLAARSAGCALSLMVLCGLLYLVLGEILLDPLLHLFGATPENLPFAQVYSRIVLLGTPFLILGNGISQLCRADGSPRYSMLTMVVGALVNCVLDPLFIFGFGWGMAGAAWATIIGQIISFLMCLWYLPRFKHVHLKKDDFRVRWPIARKVCELGASASLNQAAILVVQVVLNNLLIYYGGLSAYGANIPIAATGVALKLNGIYVSVIVGISQGTQPIVGFNYGARQYGRVRKALLEAMAADLVLGTAVWMLFQFFPEPLIELFGQGDVLYLQFGSLVLRVMMLMICIQGIQAISSNYFAAIGQPVKGVFLSMTRSILFFIPLAIFLSGQYGIEGLLWAQPAADLLSVIISIIMVALSFRSMKQMEAQPVR